MATRIANDVRSAYLEELAQCPGHVVLKILAQKWTTLILEGLEPGPLSHSDLARHVAGATQKMLTESLRGLERDGLITRSVTGSVSPRVDYALTDLGRSILGVQRMVKAWADVNIAAIHESRREAIGELT